MAESYDNGLEKGRKEGIDKGRSMATELLIIVIQEIKSGRKTDAQIAEEYKIPLDTVIRLKEIQ